MCEERNKPNKESLEVIGLMEFAIKRMRNGECNNVELKGLTKFLMHLFNPIMPTKDIAETKGKKPGAIRAFFSRRGIKVIKMQGYHYSDVEKMP